MLTYQLNREDPSSLYQQIVSGISQDIQLGRLKAGSRLPSKRTFAANNGVSLITVERAYSRLIDEGWCISRPRSGYFVAEIPDRRVELPPIVIPPVHSPQILRKTWFADFSGHGSHSQLFPFASWSTAMRRTLTEDRRNILENIPVAGAPILREAIGKFLRDFRGIRVDARQIVIGAGTENLYLLLTMLLGRNVLQALEDPGYGKLENICEALGTPCTRIPLDQYGLRVDLLEASAASLVHITPSHQFPAGIVMPISRRYELLGWASRAQGRYIVEDDYDSELRLGGRPIPPLMALDRADHVIYMNTFSKTLASAVRISYMVLPAPLTEQFNQQFEFGLSPVSTFMQYALARFIETGDYERHLNRLRSHYRRTRDALIQAIEQTPLGQYSSVSGTEAGAHFLLHVQTARPIDEIVVRAADRGINLIALHRFCRNRYMMQDGFVMDCSLLDQDRVEEAARRISWACGF